METILITGIDGFIGNHLFNYLRGKYKIIGIDRHNRHNFKNSKNFKFFKRDINSYLEDINGEIYAVIHLAARPGVRGSHKNFKDVCMDNILATQKIIRESGERWKPKKLLIASSSSVYGDTSEISNEFDGLKPKSPYAVSKITCENLLVSYKNSGYLDDTEIASLRFFTVYGPEQREDLAIQRFISNILQNKPITIFGDGKQSRDFTYVKDVCKAISLMLEKEIPSEVYNIGSGNPISLIDVIFDICTLTKKTAIIKFENPIPFDVKLTHANIDLMKNDFRWKPETKWIDGLKKQIEWQKGEQ